MKIPSRIALIGRVDRKEGKRRRKKEKKKKQLSLSCTVLIRSSFKGLKLYANQATAS